MSTRTADRTQFLADVLTTAVEGGIGYWARIMESKRAEDGSWLEITVVEYEDAYDDEALGLRPGDCYESLDNLWDTGREALAKHTHVVTLDKVAHALNEVISGDYVHKEMTARIFLANRSNDAGEIDAYDADAVVQVAALGEVVYG